MGSCHRGVEIMSSMLRISCARLLSAVSVVRREDEVVADQLGDVGDGVGHGCDSSPFRVHGREGHGAEARGQGKPKAGRTGAQRRLGPPCGRAAPRHPESPESGSWGRRASGLPSRHQGYRRRGRVTAEEPQTRDLACGNLDRGTVCAACSRRLVGRSGWVPELVQSWYWRSSWTGGRLLALRSQGSIWRNCSEAWY